MKIYIDPDFKCHTTNPDSIYQEVEADFFDSKCQEFIEGYRFIPFGESWTRNDDVVFHGEMIAPWKNYSVLDTAQRNYERQLLTEQELIIAELDAALLDVQYNNLTEGL